jgi:hypothetical protein
MDKDDIVDKDEAEIAGVQIGTAVPADKSKPVHVALKVREAEIYISADDARDIANSIIECAGYVDRLNGQEKMQ